MGTPETLKIDGVEYVRKGSATTEVKTVDGLRYCIVRTQSAGVFAGYLKSLEGQHGVVLNARRLWYWSGASSLSQLAMEGVKNPDFCKFPCEVDEVILTNVIEVIAASSDAKKSIDGVKIWAQ